MSEEVEVDVKVGGEVEAWCTTCKIMKNHVVVAMAEAKPAKVECLGCGKQHVYRAHPPGTAKPKAPRVRATVPPPAPPVDDLEQKLAQGESSASTYSAKESYEVGAFVRHPAFGVGMVVGVPAAQKMEVAFHTGRKLLVHQRSEGAPPQPPLQRPPVRSEEEPSYATDAPPPTKLE